MPLALDLNYRGILGSSLFSQFAFFVVIVDMRTNGIDVLAKQFRRLLLGQPGRLVVKMDFKGIVPSGVWNMITALVWVSREQSKFGAMPIDGATIT